jgi:hypothetical protein
MLKKIVMCSLVLGLAGCSNSAKENHATTQPAADSAATASAAEPVNEQTEFMFTTLVINIPSPFEIVGKLPKAGIPYDRTLPNPSENATKYISSTKKGLNYGIYVIDLVYVSTNKQFDQIKPYFKTARNLAQSLDCAESFDKIASSRIEENLDKEDTINKIIDQVYIEMDNYLRSNDRLLTSTQIVLGSWIESQFLTLSLIHNAEKTAANNFLFEKVSQEKGTLQRLIELLGQHKNEKDFLPVIKDIEAIHKIYVDDVKFNDIDKAAVTKLYNKISEVRTKIVS